MIESTSNDIFGVYINALINNKRYQDRDSGKWEGSSINDPNAFVFSLQSSKKQMNPMKFDILEKESKYAFTLYEEDDITLFGVGNGHDIRIVKEKYKENCFCLQRSFNYDNIQNALVELDEFTNNFEVKRIRVFQLI